MYYVEGEGILLVISVRAGFVYMYWITLILTYVHISDVGIEETGETLDAPLFSTALVFF